MWYAEGKEYTKCLQQDIQIRSFIQKECKDAWIWDVVIIRNEKEVIVRVEALKVALLLGKTRSRIEELEKKIHAKIWVKVKIEVIEVKKPEFNAKLVCFMIAQQIEKRVPYKKAVKQALQRAADVGVKGIKIKIWGRLNGVEIARKEVFKEGNIPVQTLRADIDYCSARAETIYGTIGIKVWVYKGDILHF